MKIMILTAFITRYFFFYLLIEMCSTCEFKNRKCKLNKKENNWVTPPYMV